MTGPPPPDALDPDRPSPPLLLWAYRHAIFPMADPETGALDWFSPDPRAILPLDDFRTPRTVQRAVRSGRFDVRSDVDFAAVMRACAAPRADEPLSWIDERLVESYVGLHEIGHAHSVEAWRDGRLVGGLYGVSLGAAFFGESMFVRPDEGGTDASKVCLVHLVRCCVTGGSGCSTRSSGPRTSPASGAWRSLAASTSACWPTRSIGR